MRVETRTWDEAYVAPCMYPAISNLIHKQSLLKKKHSSWIVPNDLFLDIDDYPFSLNSCRLWSPLFNLSLFPFSPIIFFPFSWSSSLLFSVLCSLFFSLLFSFLPRYHILCQAITRFFFGFSFNFKFF